VLRGSHSSGASFINFVGGHDTLRSGEIWPNFLMIHLAGCLRLFTSFDGLVVRRTNKSGTLSEPDLYIATACLDQLQTGQFRNRDFPSLRDFQMLI
jgi:hypothetical protein